MSHQPNINWIACINRDCHRWGGGGGRQVLLIESIFLLEHENRENLNLDWKANKEHNPCQTPWFDES